jgi:hypothetical protein
MSVTPVRDDAPMDEGPTRALRAHSRDLLGAGLAELLKDGEAQWAADQRDLMIVLAPYYDCAKRLGLDPASFFDEAAHAAPRSLQGAVSSFGRRDDVTPEAFGFAVVDDADGPRYVWV